MISTTYDVEADALYVRLAANETEVATTREIEPGVILDLDSSGKVVGIEVLGVRERSGLPAEAA